GRRLVFPPPPGLPRLATPGVSDNDGLTFGHKASSTIVSAFSDHNWPRLDSRVARYPVPGEVKVVFPKVYLYGSGQEPHPSPTGETFAVTVGGEDLIIERPFGKFSFIDGATKTYH